MPQHIRNPSNYDTVLAISASVGSFAISKMSQANIYVSKTLPKKCMHISHVGCRDLANRLYSSPVFGPPVMVGTPLPASCILLMW